MPGLVPATGGFWFDASCSHGGLGITFDGINGSWNIGSIIMPNYGYVGTPVELPSVPIFPNGLVLGNSSDDYTGMDRLLDFGNEPPTNAPAHLRGDIRLNQQPAPGGVAAWTNTRVAATTLAAAVTSGTTTSVAVAGCPSPALPAGTPVDRVAQSLDQHGIVLDTLLGTLSACTGTTLTFQAAAGHSAANGDTIQFLQWYPAAQIANDPGGTSWPLGKPTTIASLARCTPETIGFGVVRNGATPKADDDEVGKEGSSVRPVFCNGKKWTYLGGGIH